MDNLAPLAEMVIELEQMLYDEQAEHLKTKELLALEKDERQTDMQLNQRLSIIESDLKLIRQLVATEKEPQVIEQPTFPAEVRLVIPSMTVERDSTGRAKALIPVRTH